MPLAPRPPLVQNPEILRGVKKRVTYVSSMSLIFDGADNKAIVGPLVINQPPLDHKRENAKSGTEISVVLCFEEIVPNAITPE